MNEVTPRQSIQIGTQKNIKPSGQQVTQTNWNPADGAARQHEIEQARYQALQEHRKHLEDATTVGQRLTNLENEFSVIRQDLDKILKLLGANNVKA